MIRTFNLITEPWIPVVRDGGLSEVSLKEILYSAHKISCISDSSPIVEFGIYRFLVALVMDIWEFHGISDLKKLIDTGLFSSDKIDEYFHKYGCGFDLFDAERPFLQTADISDLSVKPISRLSPCIPSGTAANHFHHFAESDFGVSPAAAARLLTTSAPFMTAGGSGMSPSINGAPPWYTLINGKTLFHTICLNCYAEPMEMTGDAPPAWRTPLPLRRDDRCTGTSLLEALTWRPRQIRLIPSGSGVCSISGKQSAIIVRTMQYCAGASCGFHWTDPSVPYRITEKGSTVMRLQDGRDIWRDIGPFALLNDKAYESPNTRIRFTRPLLIDQFQHIIQDQCFSADKSITLTMYGMRTDMKMKVFEWRKEMLTIPISLISRSASALFLQELIEEADKVEYILKRTLKHLYPKDAVGNPKGLNTLIDDAIHQYWFDLRLEYDDILHRLGASSIEVQPEDRLTIQDEWRREIRRTARQAFDNSTEDLDTYGDSIQCLIEARLMLNKTLKNLFKMDKHTDTRMIPLPDHSGISDAGKESATDKFCETVATISSASDIYLNEVAFISELAKQDECKLVMLRRNACDKLSETAGMIWFYDLLSQYDISGRDSEAYFLTASLFVLDKRVVECRCNPDSNLGATLRSFRYASGVLATEMCPLDRRFNSILESDFDPGKGEGLSSLLGQMVKLIVSKKDFSARINWPKLLHDIRSWNLDRKPIQKSWARSYYMSASDIILDE